MSYFTLKNGERLYYEDTGSGEETVVMLHGWTNSHEVFAPCVPAISRKARCITYDHRGHGGSREANREQVTMDTLAGDLNELITGLGLREVTLLGWSMGAGVVMDYPAVYGCGALRRVGGGLEGSCGRGGEGRTTPVFSRKNKRPEGGPRGGGFY